MAVKFVNVRKNFHFAIIAAMPLELPAMGSSLAPRSPEFSSWCGIEPHSAFKPFSDHDVETELMGRCFPQLLLHQRRHMYSACI